MPKQAKTLTQQELKRVLNVTTSQRHAARNRTMLLLTHYAGMRVGEVAALKYSDVMDSDGTVREQLHLTASQTKGQEGRTVFLSSRIRKELANYLREHSAKALNGKLFYTQKRALQGFSANSLAQMFLELYASAGIHGASSHSGRRTFITNLASQGVSVRVLAQLAGHRSIATTQRYIDVNENMLRNAVELI